MSDRMTKRMKFGAGKEDFFMSTLQEVRRLFLHGGVDGYTVEIGVGSEVTICADFNPSTAEGQEAQAALELKSRQGGKLIDDMRRAWMWELIGAASALADQYREILRSESADEVDEESGRFPEYHRLRKALAFAAITNIRTPDYPSGGAVTGQRAGMFGEAGPDPYVIPLEAK